ncbi:MAG: hypothetical protein ACC652_00605 [Acidimicrobiales bacterium]
MASETGGPRPKLHAVYPGTFQPPTLAHLAIAEAALERRGISTVTFALSESALNKTHLDDSTERAETLRLALRDYPQFRVTVTRHQLISDIAQGYDLVIVGADKWQQMQDIRYYNFDSDERDASLAQLPEIAIVPRSGLGVPSSLAMGIDDAYRDVSSSDVRAGNLQWLLKTADWPPQSETSHQQRS